MAVPFSNEPISTDHLPTLANDAFVSVDPRYLRVSLAGYLIAAAVVIVGVLVVSSQVDRLIVPLAIGGVLLLLLAFGAGMQVVEVRRLGYQLREHDLSLRSGAINHRVESLPFSRVQHVNINRGPLERALGLATLQVSSAGPNITIPGLTDADAARIKAVVTERAGVDLDTSGTDTGDNTDHATAPPQ
jgi:membrane protein YdbS with pleckstrin-like domain